MCFALKSACFYGKIRQSILHEVTDLNWKTIKERISCFWFYYKIPVCIAIVVLLVGLDTLITSRQIIDPDYSVAVISTDPYTGTELDAFEHCFRLRADDLNGDGQIKVDIRYYQVNVSGEESGEYDAIMVSKLEADLAGRVSGMFLLSDPEGFQRNSHMLAYLDGSFPEEDAVNLERMVLPIREIPGLDGAGYDNLYLGIRADHPAAADYFHLLDILKEG